MAEEHYSKPNKQNRKTEKWGGEKKLGQRQAEEFKHRQQSDDRSLLDT